MLKPEKIESIAVQFITFVLFLILFLPLFIYEQSLFPFVFPRTVVFRVAIEIALVAYLPLAFLQPKYRPRVSYVAITLAGFLIVMIITTAFGAEWYRSLWSSIERSEGVITWLHFFAFFVIVSSVFRERWQWKKYFNIALIAGSIQLFYAILQYSGIPYVLRTSGPRIEGTIGNPTFLATYLFFIIFIAAWLFIEHQSIKLRSVYTTIIIVSSFMIWQTQTRGALLALVVGGILFLGILLWRKKTILSRSIIVLLILLPIAGFFIIKLNYQHPWITQNDTLYRISLISPTDVSTQNRLIVWGVGAKGFLARPLLGWGWENFQAPFNTYFDPSITRDIGTMPWFDRAHNIIIEIAVATGIIGLTLYLGIFVTSIMSIMRSRSKKIIIPMQYYLFLSLFTAYFIQNLFVFDTLNSYIMLFIVLAFIHWLSTHAADTKSQKSKRKLSISLSAGILILSLLFMIPVMYWVNIRPSLASHHTLQAIRSHEGDPNVLLRGFEKAFTYSSPSNQELRFILIQHTRNIINDQGINEDNAQLVRFAVAEAEKTIEASPHTIQNYLILAELYLVASELDPTYMNRALGVTRNALDRAPARYQIYSMLGRLDISQGRTVQAIDNFKRAVALNESFAEAHWNLAIAYILTHQLEEADRELARTRELGFNFYRKDNIQRLLAAYQDARELEAAIELVRTASDIYPDSEEYPAMLEGLLTVQQELQ